MGYRRSVLQTVTKAPLLACVVLDIDWNTPIPLQTQARTLVDDQATFTGINKNGLLVWEFEFHNCTEAELMLVRILLAGYIHEEYVYDTSSITRWIKGEFYGS